MTTAPVLEPAASSPYRYLDYFHEDDALTFAGREEDIAEVVARAAADEPFVLYGRSGLGKTSLLLAGVFPILRRDRRLNPIHVRVVGSPILDLRNAVAAAVGRPSGNDPGDLDDLLVEANESGCVVLVFDQFEELFINTRSQPEARRDFIHLVAAVVRRSHGDVRVTFSLREDYLAELDELRGAFPDILKNQYRLRPLTAFGARQAIVAPLVAAGIPFDQRLVVRLVDMLAEVEFDPVLLQIACGEVYREAMRRDEHVSLTEADLDKVGGIEGLFERYLDNAIAHVPDGQLLLCRALLDALTTPEETKRAVTFDALLRNENFQASLEEIQAVLDCLNTHKLVRPDLRGDQLFYELRHDRLAPSVVKWFKRDADFSQFRDARHLIEEATRRAAFPDRLETLISGAQIEKLIGPFRDRLRLTVEQRALLFWSAVYARVADVAFWARLFGPDRACEALCRMLALPAVEARLGSANACGQLAEGVPGLAAACLRAALDDSSEDVRHSAAVALARLATEEERAALATALRSRRTRPRALDVLATFVEEQGPVGQFGRFWRMWARRRAAARGRERHRDLIRKRAVRGALVGAFGAGIWSATIGLALICAASWLSGEVHWVVSGGSILGFGAACVTGVAVLTGWALGRVSASQAASTGREGRWARATTRLALVGLVPSALLLFLDEFSLDELGQMLVAFFLVLFLVGFYVRLLRSSVWPPTTTPRARAGWALLFGLPFTVLLAVYAVRSGSDSDGFWLVAAGCSVVPSLVALILSETAAAFPIGRFPIPAPRTRAVVRTLLAGSAIAGPLLFLGFARLDSIPFLARSHDLGGAETIRLPLRVGRTDSVYFNLRTTDTGASWFIAQYPESIRLRTATGALSRNAFHDDDRGQFIYLPAGSHRLSAVSARGPENASVTLKAVPRLDGTAIDLTEAGWVPRIVRLDEVTAKDETSPRQWRAVIAARASGQRFTDGWSVRLMLPMGLGGAPREATFSSWADESKSQTGELIQLSPNQAAANGHHVPFVVPVALDAGEFPHVDGDDDDGATLRPIPLDQDGTFRLILTYTAPAATAANGASPNALPQAGHPIDVPFLLSLRRPDATEFLLKGETDLIPRLRADAIWNDADRLEDMARRLSQVGRHDDSIVVRERVVELTPDNSARLNNLAWEIVIATKGRAPSATEGLRETALAAARKAAKLSDRKNVNTLDTLAHAEYDTSHFSEAVQAWEEVLRLKPNYYQPPADPFCADDLKLLADARLKSAAMSLR